MRYAIVYLNARHCLKCGTDESLKRVSLSFVRDHTRIDGWAILCSTCSQSLPKGSTPMSIVGPGGLEDMRHDSSVLCEVVDREYYEKFQRPQWLRDR